MPLPTVERIEPGIGIAVPTFNVHGSEATGVQRRQQLLASWLAALHDSLAGSAGSRPKAPYGFRTSEGVVSVRLYTSRIGRWRTTRRDEFQCALSATQDKLVAFLDALLGGEPPRVSSARSLVRAFLAEDFTTAHVAYVVSSLERELVALRVTPDPVEVRRANEARMREWLTENVIPAGAISFDDDGLQVDANVLASAAGVTIRDACSVFGPNFLHELQQMALAQPWSIGSKRFVPTVNRPHGRVTTPGLLFDFEALGISRHGLLDEVLAQLVPGSAHHPVGKLHSWVSWLTANLHAPAAEEARRILGTSTAQLAHNEVRRLLDLLDDVLLHRKLRNRTLSEYRGAFRAHVIRAYESAGREPPYFPRRRANALPREGRPLLSDQPDADAIDPDMRPAITQIAYGSFQQGSSRATAHLDDRMQRVRAACDQDIEEFLDVYQWLTHASELTLTEESERFADLLYRHYVSDEPDLRAWLEDAPLEQVVGAALAAMKKHRLHEREGYTARMHDKRSIRLGCALARLHDRFPSLTRWSSFQAKSGLLSAFRSLLSVWYVPRWIQLAIELRIQMETSFNRQTVRNLTVSGVQIQNATVDLQALKGKTEKMQPGGIDSADRLLISALNLMLRHSANVQRFWDQTETRLFITLVRNKSGACFGTGTDFQLLQRFIQHHGLFPFSREQIRNQKATKVYLEKGDLHEVQGLLGHESLKTVNTYIGSRVISILNQANVAHFQRALAASIVWALRDETQLVSLGLDRCDVSERLLFPIAGCSKDMPLAECDEWLDQPGVSILIDEVRIRHLVAQRRYYAANWQKLRATSPEAFEKVHRPRMEFAAALWAVVADSQYGDLLEALA